MRKNILITGCILFAVILLIIIAFAINILIKRNKEVSYLSIGDSIAAGYGLPSYKKDKSVVKESYVKKFGTEIGATKIDNIAVSGAKTNDMLTLLEDEENKNLIKNADVITIAIGSNDLLSPGKEIIFETIGAKSTTEMQSWLNAGEKEKIEMMFLIDEISKAVKNEENTNKLKNCIENYKQNFNKIIENIRKLNSKAEIIVLSYYNPYKNFVYESNGVKVIDFGDTVQKYIDEMNDYLLSDNSNNYSVAKTFDIEQEKTNVIIDINGMKFNIDPHPNEQGNDYICEKLLSAYQK